MYQVTITCPDCDGAGSIAMTSDLSSSMEHECCVCAGIGRTLVSEATELYENTAALMEDYPDAIKIERVA
jgi:DnaJ-class molecular chaperone|tara:strand:- start:180 stop:389 length:210 start_codon:yes stop_codon:yes gene_type:complete